MYITDYNIELRDIHMYAYHGVMEQERKVGAWFTVDIVLTLTDHVGALTDNIADTVNYADIYDTICKQMAVPSNLLEHVCHRILQEIMEKFASVSQAEVTLTKETPPMGGDRLKSAVTLKVRR